MAKKYWLLKSEPEAFSISDLAQAPGQITCWDGVRNYQARNYLRDDIQINDLAFFHHSNACPPGIAGVVKVIQSGYPDSTAWDPFDCHYDAKSTVANPRWFMIDVQLVTRFEEILTLELLRTVPALKSMELLRKGSRLSVQPVRADEYQTVMKLYRSLNSRRQ
ncbi:MAG: EVE domain-containing protein [Planctomycetota bacterium]|nr:EVE domain-containing protein [Planctomycetota bacterium]MDA1177405.1 EVE domain-containing protein [Planctomycetota bacterium]